MPISLWAKTQSFLFPTRSSLVKEPEPLPQPLRFRQRRSGNLPRPVQLVNNFFSNPEVFFGARREDFSPAQKRELIPTPSRCQPLSSAFFKKLVRPAVPASRPCPAQRDIPSRSGENGLCTSTPPLSTTFIFFLIFFFTPQRPFDVWCLIRGYHMLSLITCRQLPSGVFTVIALWKRPRPRSARQRRVPEQT